MASNSVTAQPRLSPRGQSPSDSSVLDKRSIAASFSRAAQSYDSLAAIQRQVGHQLMSQASRHLQGRVMDLGSGTGYFSSELIDQSQIDEVLSVDLAEGMLAYARQQRSHANIRWICADAEALPLADNSLDGVFSNFSIQWCEDLPRLFDEIRRVLKPRGMLAFSTLGPDTLKELRQSWAKVDDFVHVNRFQPRQQLQQALANGYQPRQQQEQLIELEYQRLNQLTEELKGIGAHNVNQGRIAGLAGRKRIQAFRNAYEDFRKSNGMLPATYQIYYGVYQKR
ncbi:MAG: malonyl-ACP O-methyltransferase BioC [Motiliproteus sp.]|nr:malonyl-ACP O-methyltransferase BioC [Motiliproteus sp.]MCW9050781.1 malonyl-ACP O-methyltransferase BioC [Motiliproteus sp.]